MSFTDLLFPLFLMVVVLLYYLLPARVGKYLLLAASWFFYGFGNWNTFLLLPAVTLLTYVCARRAGGSRTLAGRRVALAAALVLCIGALVAFKYLGFFADIVGSVAGLFGQGGLSLPQLVLPVGLSFYTFQTLSYVIDVYLGKAEAERDFCLYAVYVSFFPQLVAGPIERFGDLMPQLREKHPFEADNIRCGLAMILCGYIKKVIVADTVAIAVDCVFNAAELSSLTAISVLVAAALFFVQIYCDFSGYSDIALGCARLLGIRLTKNFDRPFQAKSVTEFWGRWHITLSRWFGEYVYMPLAFRTRHKKGQTFYRCLYTMIVMLLCGLWHGADWSFVLWGGALGALQVLEIALRRPMAKLCAACRVDPDGAVLSAVRRFGTLFAITLTMILFRAGTFSDAAVLFGQLFTGWHAGIFADSAAQLGLGWPLAAVILLGVALLSLADRTIADGGGEIACRVRGASAAFAVQCILWCVLLAAALQVACGQTSSFIYFQF